MADPLDPEHTRDIEDLRRRLEQVEARSTSLEHHVLYMRDRARRRALLGLWAALGGLPASLFLPWTEENGLHHLSALFLGGEETSFMGMMAAGVGAMLLAGCVALPFWSRPGAPAVLTGCGVLAAVSLGMLFLFSLGETAEAGPGMLVALVAAFAVPTMTSRVTQNPRVAS